MKWSMAITLAFVLVLGIYVLSVYKSDASACSIEVVNSYLSPKGDLHAVQFTRKCGSTSDITSNISILPASIGLAASDRGNIYIAEGDARQISINWLDEEKLQIKGIDTRPYKQAVLFGGIHVLYSN